MKHLLIQWYVPLYPALENGRISSQLLTGHFGRLSRHVGWVIIKKMFRMSRYQAKTAAYKNPVSTTGWSFIEAVCRGTTV